MPMNVKKVGETIANLRKKAGYTQKDLANRLGISDKAVSKWERGVGLPDISYLSKLSILLDTDTDSLLAGDVGHHDNSWRGIILLDNNKYGIDSSTMIFDKPLVFFLLSYFLLVGIRNITIIGSQNDKRYIDEVLGSGNDYGIVLSTYVGDSLADIRNQYSIDNGNTMLVYGRCILYGVEQTKFFQKAMNNRDRFTTLVLPKKLNDNQNRIVFDKNKKIVNSESDELLKTQYDFSDIPFLFFPSKLLNDMFVNPNILSFVNTYSAENEVYVQLLDRGFVEIEIDDWNCVQDASTFLKIVQDKCGMNVYCLEEVAWRRGMISNNQLNKLGSKYLGTPYGEYIKSLYERNINK